MKSSVIIIEEQTVIMINKCAPFDKELAKRVANVDVSEFKQRELKIVGEIYRNLSEQYKEEIDLVKVDPRNPVYLLPKLIKETVRNRVPFVKALHTIFFYRVPSIIVNGEMITSGQDTLKTSNVLEKINIKLNQ